VEAPEELPRKTKSFFIHAVENWDAEFYAKVNDDVYVNIGMSLIFLANDKVVSPSSTVSDLHEIFLVWERENLVGCGRIVA
jgi:hypothetical protein